ncbi:hypothetical protein PR202_gb16365 [Eleusine coracana subsp. coracana]|uniref:Serine-threonine/tyrosine-protein kinase catalytic domain-containing protein n=1 Tax=Eleusine coracana subsp. coracana TaxID=191504 RepID=A0AAV5F1R9_ELECO|nr:hypothetical protein PR202_gb16365 [Eleusine coracana subsp. coracana]
MKEADCLTRLKHNNIVRSLGYCADAQGEMLNFEGKMVIIEERQRLLCFEYLPKGRLDKYISGICSLRLIFMGAKLPYISHMPV